MKDTEERETHGVMKLIVAYHDKLCFVVNLEHLKYRYILSVNHTLNPSYLQPEELLEVTHDTSGVSIQYISHHCTCCADITPGHEANPITPYLEQ